MKKLRLATLSLVVILALIFPSLSLADAPQRFDNTVHWNFLWTTCNGFEVWADAVGTIQGFQRYGKDGQVVYTFQQLKWDFKYYNSTTGKAAYGSGVFLNFYQGDWSTPLRATMSYRVTAPHWGMIYGGAGQTYFSTPVPDPAGLLRETGHSPFWGIPEQFCAALAP